MKNGKMIWNISERIPDLVVLFTELVKILSIRMADNLVTLVGLLIRVPQYCCVTDSA